MIKNILRAEPAAEQPVVLVVDDDLNSLSMLYRMLEEAGYIVLVAGDGETAIKRLNHIVPDAILLDAIMPGLSGFETCERIKSIPALIDIPVIFMTGLSDTESVVCGFNRGGVDYVVKPVREPEILARLQTHIRNAKITTFARNAVDVASLGVALIDPSGRVAWRSSKAAAWLGRLSPSGDIDRIPPQLMSLVDESSANTRKVAQGSGGESYVVTKLGTTGMGETMLLIERQFVNANAVQRLESAALTQRETEVLSWLSKGKTNRDIGDILGLSPRTVNKHLENIFKKLGVETRTAAAALGVAGLDAAASGAAARSEQLSSTE